MRFLVEKELMDRLCYGTDIQRSSPWSPNNSSWAMAVQFSEISDVPWILNGQNVSLMGIFASEVNSKNNQMIRHLQQVYLKCTKS